MTTRAFLLTAFTIGLASIATAQQATVKSGDRLRITVKSDPSISGDYTVAGNGEVLMPILGKIRVVGKTTKEIAKQIRNIFEAEYFKSEVLVGFSPVKALPANPAH